MRDNIESLIKKADFSKGSNHKEELKTELFGDGNKAKIIKLEVGKELSDDELEYISAAGLYEEEYNKKKSKKKEEQ